MNRPLKNKKPPVNLIELIQDGGGLPGVTLRSASISDWQRILLDAHSDLTRELCYYHHEPTTQTRRVNKALETIEYIAQQWRLKGPKE